MPFVNAYENQIPPKIILTLVYTVVQISVSENYRRSSDMLYLRYVQCDRYLHHVVSSKTHSLLSAFLLTLVLIM